MHHAETADPDKSRHSTSSSDDEGARENAMARPFVSKGSISVAYPLHLLQKKEEEWRREERQKCGFLLSPYGRGRTMRGRRARRYPVGSC